MVFNNDKCCKGRFVISIKRIDFGNITLRVLTENSKTYREV